MPTRLIIARHGNTFNNNQTPTRIGGETDLPLIEEQKGIALGKYLKENNLIPAVIFSSPLQRTLQTSQLIKKVLSIVQIPTITSEIFREIDYGPDENKTEHEVIYRLGKAALPDNVSQPVTDDEIISKGKEIIDLWNKRAIVPRGWLVKPEQIMQTWKLFAAETEERYKEQNVLVVTSNGIARFSVCLTNNMQAFAGAHDLKIATGALCIFEKDEGSRFWNCMGWNIRPGK